MDDGISQKASAGDGEERPHRTARRGRALLIAGYVTAIVLPIVGVVLGVLILIRRHTWHGVTIVALSLAMVLAILALTHSGEVGELRPADKRAVHRMTNCLSRQLTRQVGADAALRACESMGRRRPSANAAGSSE